MSSPTIAAGSLELLRKMTSASLELGDAMYEVRSLRTMDSYAVKNASRSIFGESTQEAVI